MGMAERQLIIRIKEILETRSEKERKKILASKKKVQKLAEDELEGSGYVDDDDDWDDYDWDDIVDVLYDEFDDESDDESDE